MIRKILVAGVTAAAIVGAGTAALAASGPSNTSGIGTLDHPIHRAARALLHHAVHGQVVTSGKHGDVRHDVVIGTVTAVSAQSITVTASDGYRETFVVGDRTLVRQRSDHSGTRSTIGAVHTGDRVVVLGRTADGTKGAATARLIVDGIRR